MTAVVVLVLTALMLSLVVMSHLVAVLVMMRDPLDRVMAGLALAVIVGLWAWMLT